MDHIDHSDTVSIPLLQRRQQQQPIAAANSQVPPRLQQPSAVLHTRNCNRFGYKNFFSKLVNLDPKLVPIAPMIKRTAYSFQQITGTQLQRIPPSPSHSTLFWTSAQFNTMAREILKVKQTAFQYSNKFWTSSNPTNCKTQSGTIKTLLKIMGSP